MKKIISLILSVCICVAANIPRSTSAFEPIPHFTSTFIQPYYNDILDTERWEQTFSHAKKLGFDTLIIPSVLYIHHQSVLFVTAGFLWKLLLLMMCDAAETASNLPLRLQNLLI